MPRGGEIVSSAVRRNAEYVGATGGEGIAVRVDHADDTSVSELFARVSEESCRVDLLVNDTAVIHVELSNPAPFWEKPIELGDVLDVGLRSSCVASWHAARMMAGQDRGLIVFTSSPGSVCYMHGRPTARRKSGSTNSPPIWRWISVALAETPEFTGYLIDALYRDADLPALSGQTVIGAELAARYGITDAGGRTPPSDRDVLGAPRMPNPAVVR